MSVIGPELIELMLVGIHDMPAYRWDDTAPPCPESVTRAHDNIHLSYTETSGHASGHFVKRDDGDYEIIVPESRSDDLYAGVIEKTFKYRRRFTIAHELGHFWLLENVDTVLRLLNLDCLTRSIAEQICDYFAAYFLMPPSLMRQKTQLYIEEYEHAMQDKAEGNENHAQSLPQNKPIFVFKKLANFLEVNATALLFHLVRTGVWSEQNWLIALFRFGLNPDKQSGARWILSPNSLVLPFGLSRSKAIGTGEAKLHKEPGFRNAGMFTMRLAPLKWELMRSGSAIYNDLMSRLNTDRGLINDNPDYPWYDLNRPPLFDNPGSKGDVPKHQLSLQYQRLRKESQSNMLPLAGSIFRYKEQVPKPGSALWNDWRNAKWRLSAHDLRLIPWRRENNQQFLLVAAELFLQIREDSHT